MLDFCVEGRGFDPQPGQKMIRIFSPVTSVHSPGLIRVFAVYSVGSLGHEVYSCKQ